MSPPTSPSVSLEGNILEAIIDTDLGIVARADRPIARARRDVAATRWTFELQPRLEAAGGRRAWRSRFPHARGYPVRSACARSQRRRRQASVTH